MSQEYVPAPEGRGIPSYFARQREAGVRAEQAAQAAQAWVLTERALDLVAQAFAHSARAGEFEGTARSYLADSVHDLREATNPDGEGQGDGARTKTSL